MPTRAEEKALTIGKTVCGTVVTVERSSIEIFDGSHRYWVNPSTPVRIGQVVNGTVTSVLGVLVFQISVVAPPDREELARSEKQASASPKKAATDVTDHNQTVKFFAPVLKKRTKVTWGVFNNSNELIKKFSFAQRDEATACASALTEERNVTYYVDKILEYMD